MKKEENDEEVVSLFLGVSIRITVLLVVLFGPACVVGFFDYVLLPLLNN